VNIAQQDLIAQKTKTCPRCGAEPRKRCWEKARSDPRRKTFLARPHAERAELVDDERELLAHRPGIMLRLVPGAVASRRSARD
jgi:hypothetical protein